MRRRLMVSAAILLVLPVTASAQDTLFGGEVHSGGYGGPTAAVSSFNGSTVAFAGGQGGWVINKMFVIGGAGRGMASPMDLTVAATTYDLEFGYGGLLLEYLHGSDSVLHTMASVVVGGGGVSLLEQGVASTAADDDAVWVVEPGFGVEMNITPWFRFGVQGHYRLVTGLTSRFETDYGLTDSDLSGALLTFEFRFGRY